MKCKNCSYTGNDCPVEETGLNAQGQEWNGLCAYLPAPPERYNDCKGCQRNFCPTCSVSSWVESYPMV